MADDTTVPIPSPNEVFIDRYRKITPKWYPFIRKIFENLRSTINQVTSLETTVEGVNQFVDNVSGLYGVAVNANGRVTAAIQLDGSPAQSSFAILADKFVVVHPTVNNTTIQAFVVGTVNGVSTVGINGNLIVDGTIEAEAINANSLSAINANLGTITAGVLQSADGKMVINLNSKFIRISN